MNTLKLKHLLSRRYPSQNADRITLFNRIRSEHLFTSVDECIEYLYVIIRKQNLNPDNILPVPYDMYPNLVINVVDEAICSMIYEIYQQINRGDKSMLGYFRMLIDNFYTELENLDAKLVETTDDCRFYKPLLTMFYRLGCLADPTMQTEEHEPKQLARAYYDLMYTMYKYAKPYSDYNRTLENFYYDLLKREMLV